MFLDGRGPLLLLEIHQTINKNPHIYNTTLTYCAFQNSCPKV